MHIEFPPGETDDTSTWVVWFLAVVHGQQITCGISYHALRMHCGADFDDPMPAFVTNRQRIEQIITTRISHGRFEEDETMVIRSHDILR